MAAPKSSSSDIFSLVVSKSMLCRKHQLTLPAEVARDLGLKKGTHPRFGVSVNAWDRYWISFKFQKGKGGGWRSTSGWKKLVHRHPVKEGDNLEFTRQPIEDGFFYLVRSDRLEDDNFDKNMDLKNLFNFASYFEDSEDEDEGKCTQIGSDSEEEGPSSEE